MIKHYDASDALADQSGWADGTLDGSPAPGDMLPAAPATAGSLIVTAAAPAATFGFYTGFSACGPAPTEAAQQGQPPDAVAWSAEAAAIVSSQDTGVLTQALGAPAPLAGALMMDAVQAAPASLTPDSAAGSAVTATQGLPVTAELPGSAGIYVDASNPGNDFIVLGEVAGNAAVTSATRVTDDYSDHALQADTARATYGIDGSTTSTGAVIRIGILSDSFNDLGGAAADEADGDLPTAVNVHDVSDSTGGEDEGRAMAELVHRIAPGAQIYFYSGENGQSNFATGITTLASDGCQVIIDDLSYLQEPFYQADGTVQKAVDTVTAAGVTYFTSVTNNGHAYYESAWNNLAGFALPGVGTENVQNVGNGSPYETVSLGTGYYAEFDLQWEAPFQSLGGTGDTFTLGMALYDVTSGTPVLEANFKPDNALGGDPTNVHYYYNGSSDTKFEVVFYQYSGVAPSGEFKSILLNTTADTFTGVGSGVGSGATYGHNAAPDADPTAAVYYGNTPANGGTLSNESFSSEGGTVLYYDASGNKLATPVTLANPAFSSTDGDTTSDPDISPFYGTSAAAPDAGACAALVLAEDGRLTNTQVSYLLGATATAFGNDLYSGDGLINANAAVAAAHTAVNTPIWTGQGGSSLWSTAANWSDNAAPTAATGVTISNGIGLISSAYTVVENLTAASAAAIQIDGAGAALYSLSAVAAPVLQVAAGSTLTTAAISVGLGNLDIFGRVNDTGFFAAASAPGTADADADTTAATAATKATIEAAGTFEVGGAVTGSIAFNGGGGALILDTAALTSAITGPISNFAATDRIDLTQLGYSAADKVTVSGSSVTISNGATVLASLTVAGAFSGLTLSSDGSSGTNITAGRPADDFNADGKSDLLLQNNNGSIVFYGLNGLAVNTTAFVNNPGPTWHVVGEADFNGDGKPDILLQNDNGSLVDYLMNGTTVSSAYSLGSPGSGWHVRGTADFNGDGKADILLQNDNGSMVLYDTNGTGITAGISLGQLPAGWAVEGVGDFNGDGVPDVLVESGTGTLVDYTMNSTGTGFVAGGTIANVGAGWSVAGVADYNGDGKADILLHNDSGADVVFTQNGSTVTAATAFGNPGASYQTTVTGIDINGDGTPDVVVQGTSSTLIGYTLNNTAAITAGAVLNTPGAGWNLVGGNPTTFIDGTGSNLTLTATPGPDQFNLTTTAAGIHTIASFDPAQDAVALSVAAFPNYATVQANEAAYQGGTFINLSATTAIVIQGVTPSQLTAANFVLR